MLADAGVFGQHAWQTMVIDEAHRFKSLAGATRRVVASMAVRWKLLLTGAHATDPPLLSPLRSCHFCMSCMS